MNLKIIRLKDYQDSWYDDLIIVDTENFEKAVEIIKKVVSECVEKAQNNGLDYSIPQHCFEALDDVGIPHLNFNSEYSGADFEIDV